MSSSFVSVIIITSALPLTYEANKSDLFHMSKNMPVEVICSYTFKLHGTLLADSVTELSDMH